MAITCQHFAYLLIAALQIGALRLLNTLISVTLSKVIRPGHICSSFQSDKIKKKKSYAILYIFFCLFVCLFFVVVFLEGGGGRPCGSLFLHPNYLLKDKL